MYGSGQSRGGGRQPRSPFGSGPSAQAAQDAYNASISDTDSQTAFGPGADGYGMDDGMGQQPYYDQDAPPQDDYYGGQPQDAYGQNPQDAYGQDPYGGDGQYPYEDPNGYGQPNVLQTPALSRSPTVRSSRSRAASTATSPLFRNPSVNAPSTYRMSMYSGDPSEGMSRRGSVYGGADIPEMGDWGENKCCGCSPGTSLTIWTLLSVSTMAYFVYMPIDGDLYNYGTAAGAGVLGSYILIALYAESPSSLMLSTWLYTLSSFAQMGYAGWKIFPYFTEKIALACAEADPKDACLAKEQLATIMALMPYLVCAGLNVFFVVIVVFRAMAARRSLLVPQAGKMGGGMDDAFGPSIQSTASYY